MRDRDESRAQSVDDGVLRRWTRKQKVTALTSAGMIIGGSFTAATLLSAGGASAAVNCVLNSDVCTAVSGAGNTATGSVTGSGTLNEVSGLGTNVNNAVSGAVTGPNGDATAIAGYGKFSKNHDNTANVVANGGDATAVAGVGNGSGNHDNSAIANALGHDSDASAHAGNSGDDPAVTPGLSQSTANNCFNIFNVCSLLPGNSGNSATATATNKATADANAGNSSGIFGLAGVSKDNTALAQALEKDSYAGADAGNAPLAHDNSATGLTTGRNSDSYSSAGNSLLAHDNSAVSQALGRNSDASASAGNGLSAHDNSANANATDLNACATSGAGDGLGAHDNNATAHAGRNSTSIALAGSTGYLGDALDECLGFGFGFPVVSLGASGNTANATSDTGGLAVSVADNFFFGLPGSTATSTATDNGKAIAAGLRGGTASAVGSGDGGEWYEEGPAWFLYGTAVAFADGPGSDAQASALDGATAIAVMSDGNTGVASASGAGMFAYAGNGDVACLGYSGTAVAYNSAGYACSNADGDAYYKGPLQDLVVPPIVLL